MQKLIVWLENVLGQHPFLVIFTNFFAALFSMVIVWLCLDTGSPDSEASRLNVLVALLGALLGWALGMFLTPYSQAEAAKFISVGQAVSVFVTGYALSKLDRFLEKTLFDESVMPDSLGWLRLGLFAGSALLVMLLVFSNRAYFRAPALGTSKSKDSPEDDQAVPQASSTEPSTPAGPSS